MTQPTEAEISTFIDEYLRALSKIVEKEGKKIVETGIKPSFPVEFPVKASVFLAERGLVINFEKAEKLSISFSKERPPEEHGWGEFLLYGHFRGLKGNAAKKARSDVDWLLAIPAELEQQDEDNQGMQIEAMQFDIDSFIDFLNK